MPRHRLVTLLAFLAALTLSPDVRGGHPTWADNLAPQAITRHPARPFLPLIGMTLVLLVGATVFGPCRTPLPLDPIEVARGEPAPGVPRRPSFRPSANRLLGAGPRRAAARAQRISS